MTRRIGSGRGFRKAILINEHFVVYGVPAIAVPIFHPVEVTAEIAAGEEIVVERDRGRDVVERAPLDSDLMRAAREIFLGVGMSPGEARVRLFCRDSLPGWSGLGSSAAFCVAAARALCEAQGSACGDESVNAAAYRGERVFASNPSGIDNTVATYGRPVWYRRGAPTPCSFLSYETPLHLVLANSGSPSLTRIEVDRVAGFRQQHPDVFEAACREADKVAEGARSALEGGDLAALGKAMDRAHELLQTLGVSTPRLDRMTALCRDQGALGAKLTGAGGGGCMIALARDQAAGEAIVAGLRRKGYEAFLAPPATDSSGRGEGPSGAGIPGAR